MILRINIDGPQQSGKTRSAVGIVKQMAADNVLCLWVAPTYEEAHWQRQSRRVECSIVGAQGCLNLLRAMDKSLWRVIALDDLDRLPNDMVRRLIREAKRALGALDGPTQLITINSGGVGDDE